MSMNQITVTARTPMSQSTARNKLELVPRPRNDQRAVSPTALFLASLTSMFPPPPPPPPFPPLLFLFFYLSTGSGFLARCLFEKGGGIWILKYFRTIYRWIEIDVRTRAVRIKFKGEEERSWRSVR